MGNLNYFTIRPEAVEIDLDSTVDEFHQDRGIKSDHSDVIFAGKGNQLFCRSEVEFKHAFNNETSMPNQGIPGKVLIGEWKYAPYKNLFVRTELISGRPTICGGSGRNQWIYQVLADYKNNSRVESQLVTFNGIGVKEVKRVIEIGQRFETAVYAHTDIIKSRETLPVIKG